MVDTRGLSQVSDEAELSAVIDQILADNPALVDEFKSGDDKVRPKKVQAVMGLAMKATRGQANGPLLRELIQRRLEG